MGAGKIAQQFEVGAWYQSCWNHFCAQVPCGGRWELRLYMFPLASTHKILHGMYAHPTPSRRHKNKTKYYNKTYFRKISMWMKEVSKERLKAFPPGLHVTELVEEKPRHGFPQTRSLLWFTLTFSLGLLVLEELQTANLSIWDNSLVSGLWMSWRCPSQKFKKKLKN